MCGLHPLVSGITALRPPEFGGKCESDRRLQPVTPKRVGREKPALDPRRKKPQPTRFSKAGGPGPPNRQRLFNRLSSQKLRSRAERVGVFRLSNREFRRALAIDGT